MFGYHSKEQYEIILHAMFALCFDFLIFRHRDYNSVPKPSVLPCCQMPTQTAAFLGAVHTRGCILQFH